MGIHSLCRPRQTVYAADRRAMVLNLDTFLKNQGTFGQGCWGKREGFVNLLEWVAALGNAQDMSEWIADSEAARMLAGRLRNDHA